MKRYFAISLFPLFVFFFLIQASSMNAQGSAPENILINEVDADTPGSDTAEFIELFDGGTGNVSLDSLVLVFYNGYNDKSYAAYDLDGYTTDNNGYFVLGNAGVPEADKIISNSSLQNGADAVALFLGDASDFPNGTAITTANLLDAIVYDTGDADDSGLLQLLNSGQPQVDEDGLSDKDNHSNQRIPNGSGGKRNTSSYGQMYPTPGRTNDINPVSTDNSIVINEDSPYTFKVSDFLFNDPNGDIFDGIVIVSIETRGDLEYNSIDVNDGIVCPNVTKLKFYPGINESGAPYASFTFKVMDSSGELSINSYTMTIIVNSINDAPTLNNIEPNPLIFMENDPPVVITSRIKVKDSDDINMYSATVSITRNYQSGEDILGIDDTSVVSAKWNETAGTLNLTGIASRLTYQRLLRRVVYKNTRIDNPITSTRTITFRVSDENSRSNKEVRDIIVNAVNDIPILEGLEQSELTFIEGGPPLRLTDSVSVADKDNTYIQSALVQIFENYKPGEDLLSFNNSGNITGYFNYDNAALTLKGADSKENYQNALRSVEYLNVNAHDPDTLTRKLSFQVWDDLDTSIKIIREIAVKSINDPPVIEMLEQHELTFVEGDPPLHLADSVHIIDVDNTNIQSASIQITENYKPGEDLLSFDAAGNISGNFNIGDGTLTFAGPDSKENYQNALRSVEYFNTNTDDPDSLPRTVSFLIYDGENQCGPQTRIINVSAVNDPPVIDTSNVDITPSIVGSDSLNIPLAVYDENQSALTYSAQSSSDSIRAEIVFNSPASLLIVPLFNADISAAVIVIVSDGVYSDTLKFFVEITEKNYSPFITGLKNYTINEGGHFDDISLDNYVNDQNHNDDELAWTITGSMDLVCDITDSRMMTISIPDPEWFGKETIILNVEDPDGLADSIPVTFTVLPVNDPPVIKELPLQNFNEDDTLTISLDMLQSYVHDVETPNHELIYYVTQGKEVSYELIGPVTGINFFADENWFGFDTLTFFVSDEDTTVSQELIINVMSVNDIPMFADLPDTVLCDGDTTRLNLWEYTNDIETADENLIYEFTGYDDGLLYLNYNNDNGNLSISVTPGYNNPISFTITVTDEDGGAAAADLIYKPRITTGLGEIAQQIPDNYLIEQNYPNPFNPSTTIRFGLPSESNVNIAIYNMLGELVNVLIDEVKHAGYFEYRWNASGLSSGIYIYSLYAEATDRSARFSQVKKMILLR